MVFSNVAAACAGVAEPAATVVEATFLPVARKIETRAAATLLAGPAEKSRKLFRIQRVLGGK
jgi:hypothetical protein